LSFIFRILVLQIVFFRLIQVQFPLGIDIGGTMTKIIFFRPIETPELPSYVIREPAKLGELPISRCNALMKRLDQLSGVLRFIKIPSEFVPEFVDFLVESGLSKKVGNHVLFVVLWFKSEIRK
jgi:hypothetical protein